MACVSTHYTYMAVDGLGKEDASFYGSGLEAFSQVFIVFVLAAQATGHSKKGGLFALILSLVYLVKFGALLVYGFSKGDPGVVSLH